MTTVELFKDIGLYMSMKKTIDFTTKTAQNTWFSSKVSKTIKNVAFNKLQNLLHIPMDYGEALDYTYVRFKDLDNSGRIYYYFIHSATLIDDTTVAFQLVLDPIQTFMTEWELGECMVNRKHCDRWAKPFDDMARMTPNSEGINAFENVLTVNMINSELPIGDNTYYVFNVVIGLKPSVNGFTSLIIYPFFINKVTGKLVDSKAYDDKKDKYIGTFIDISDGYFFTRENLDVSRVNFIVVVPFNLYNFTYSEIKTDDYVSYIRLETNPDTHLIFSSGDDHGYYYTYNDVVEKSFTVNLSVPLKPYDGVSYDEKYEPALFLQPYRRYEIVDMLGNSFEIPEVYLNNPWFSITIKVALSASNQSMMIFGTHNRTFEENVKYRLSDAREGLLGQISLSTLDVYTNEWLTYCLTQRATDRQILNNQLMQSTIDNALFMGYGGALVGSRGGGQGYAQGLGKATGPAVALAVGASLAGSAVDAHFAWENQDLKERQLSNNAPSLLSAGNNGYVNTILGFNLLGLVYKQCDYVNYSKAAKNYRYYGYSINEWQKPNIKSRKYFDYILTNGAVIDGALNQDIKEQIASIFDNGVTIFHGDYSKTLDYPSYENIERALL